MLLNGKKNVCINNTNISFKLDSGSDINVLPFNYLSKLNIDVKNINNHGIKGSNVWRVLVKCKK